MGKNLWPLIVLGIAMLSLFGCSGMQVQKTATIELEGNPTTGFTWIYTMSPEAIVREVSNEYIPDKTDEQVMGSGGKFVFIFESIAAGEADIAFSYLRVWEENIPAAKTVTYRATVDGKNNLTIALK